MFPSQHLIIGTIFVSLLLWFFPEITAIGFLIIIASTILIDVDHYLLYMWITKDWSLKNAYNWHKENHRKFLKLTREEKKELRHGFYLFHGIEPLIVVFLLAYMVSSYFYFTLIGMMLHLVLDIIFGIYHKSGFHRVFLIYDIMKFDESKMIHNRK